MVKWILSLTLGTAVASGVFFACKSPNANNAALQAADDGLSGSSSAAMTIETLVAVIF